MPVVGVDPYGCLDAAMQRHLVGYLGGDPDRDIDGLVTHPDPLGRLYIGTWRGHPRLKAGVMVDANHVADVCLVATKGSVCADESLFGTSGPDIGNSLLVVRLLQVAAFALRSAGVLMIRNDPFDARVRRLYEDMGFQNGETLVLDDLPSMTTMFDYVAHAYRHPSAAGRLSLGDPPLPL
jgi:hypothetical protein